MRGSDVGVPGENYNGGGWSDEMEYFLFSPKREQREGGISFIVTES